MEFKGLKKIHDGHFIHRYDITYETVDGKEKVYEMISRNPDISTLSELQAKTPDSSSSSCMMRRTKKYC